LEVFFKEVVHPVTFMSRVGWRVRIAFFGLAHPQKEGRSLITGGA
jgi:hypothetical protein